MLDLDALDARVFAQPRRERVQAGPAARAQGDEADLRDPPAVAASAAAVTRARGALPGATGTSRRPVWGA